jgi:hypothetical protein
VWTSTEERRTIKRPPVAAIAGVAAAAVSGLITLLAIHNRSGADFRWHVAITEAGLNGGSFPGDVLFYWLESVFALFKPDTHRLYAGLAVMLTIAGGVKTYLTVRHAENEYQARLPWFGVLLAASCMFAFGIPFGPDYPAFIPANVWHNTTTALLMPLALGLFLISLAYLREPSRRDLWIALALVVVNILAKPSFVLCWLVAFPVALFVRGRRGSALFGPLLVVGAGGLLLLAQYTYVYVIGRGNPFAESSGVYLAPLHVWSHLAPNIVLSIVASYAFPAVALAFGGEAVRGNLAVRFALGLAVVGLAWFVLVGEKGHQEFHGNFMWQAIITNYVLFAALVGAVLGWLRDSAFGWRQWVVLGVFGLHLAGGVHYLAWWLTYNAP